MISRNPSTGQTEARRIVSVSHSHTDLLLAMTLCDAVTGQPVETLEATRQLPFYVEGKGFVAAAALGIGNAIVTRAGPSLVVGAMAWERRTAGYEVYNLIVEGDHTYFVGDSGGGVWVHNGPGDCGLTLPFDDDPVNLQARADAIHGALDPIAQANRATAVLEAEGAGGSKHIIVASNEPGVLAKSQRGALTSSEIAAKGTTRGVHAEDNAIRHAQSLGLTPRRIGVAGQPICPNCRLLLAKHGITQ